MRKSGFWMTTRCGGGGSFLSGLNSASTSSLAHEVKSYGLAVNRAVSFEQNVSALSWALTEPSSGTIDLLGIRDKSIRRDRPLPQFAGGREPLVAGSGLPRFDACYEIPDREALVDAPNLGLVPRPLERCDADEEAN